MAPKPIAMERQVPGFLRDLANSLLSVSAVRIAAASLLISIGVFAVVLAIFGFTYGDGRVSLGNSMSNLTRGTLSGVFVIFFIFVWFLMYVQITKEADDVYSRVRGKLTGGWSVTYQATNGPDGKNVFAEPLRVDCSIHINPNNKKLEFEFDIRGNPAYEDGKQVITAVALRHDIGNRYEVFYYYEGRRKLKELVNRLIVPDPQFSPHDGLEIEIFGILKFEDNTTDKMINLMAGEWFDLNGKVTQIFALLADARSTSGSIHNIVPRKLSDVDIHLANFAAKMGGIEYKRLI